MNGRFVKRMDATDWPLQKNWLGEGEEGFVNAVQGDIVYKITILKVFDAPNGTTVADANTRFPHAGHCTRVDSTPETQS